MPGLRITIPTTFDDDTLPVLRADPILPESGALLLLEPGHPTAGAISLANNAPLPNIAAEQAATLVSVEESNTNPTLAFASISATPNSTGVVEETTKGGIHTILSTGATLASGDGLVIRPAQAIVDYMVANPDHAYYVSLWLRITRTAAQGVGLSGASLASTATSVTADQFYSFNAAGAFRPSTGTKIGSVRVPDPLEDDAPAYLSGAVSAYNGTPEVSGAAARDRFKVWGIGNHLPFNVIAAEGSPSAILYRVYLEDLTVSGRTYAEVEEIDQGLYTQEVLTAGGRYYGDTFTDPETIP